MSQIPELVGGNALSHGVTLFVDHGGASGKKMAVGGQASQTVAASPTHTNSDAEVALEFYAIPAKTLVVGSTIRVSGAGIAPGTNATDTLQIFLRLGPTATALASREALLTTAAIDATNNDIWFIDGIIQVRTTGATGTAVAMISYQDPDATGTAPKKILKAQFTLNTTVETTLSMSAIWSAANAGNQCRADMFVVDIVNPNT